MRIQVPINRILGETHPKRTVPCREETERLREELEEQRQHFKQVKLTEQLPPLIHCLFFVFNQISFVGVRIFDRTVERGTLQM
jgi:hypothetical protein